MPPLAIAAFMALAVVLAALLFFLFRLAAVFKSVNSSLKAVITELDDMTGRTGPIAPAVEELNERIERLRRTLGELPRDDAK